MREIHRYTISVVKQMSHEYEMYSVENTVNNYAVHQELTMFYKPVKLQKQANRQQTLPGASVRNSARGKGHEEASLAYAKAGLSLRSPPGNS